MSVSDAGIFNYDESYIFPNLQKVKANTILKIIEKSETDENDKTKTSKKTKTYSYIKLPTYAVTIYEKYKQKSDNKTLFRSMYLANFNKTLKDSGRSASGISSPFTIAS